MHQNVQKMVQYEVFPAECLLERFKAEQHIALLPNYQSCQHCKSCQVLEKCQTKFAVLSSQEELWKVNAYSIYQSPHQPEAFLMVID